MLSLTARGRVSRLAAKHLLPCVLFSSCPSAVFDPDPSLLNATKAPLDFDNSASVYREFITEAQEQTLIEELQAKLKRSRYQKGHWDAAIVDYRETEVIDEASTLSVEFRGVLERVRAQILARHLMHKHQSVAPELLWLPCHCIDLKKEGELNAHVDSVRFSGDIVAGLSLMSSSIMRLREEKQELVSSQRKQTKDEPYVDLFLQERSLYVLEGYSRYRYTHELLPSGSTFGDKVVHRENRLSIIFRDSK
ncbi:predicted protein [Phaeodactylum tricornutum CCAP 1055/1]|jgi:alkylated DNA repair protein alkB family protein 7|uniref:Alpha-ketoglutarate-dependent dioxygenase AlkB-like domain-containing protein n=1 Tax=Phaeodactylum tricornutum (strain CCAP 1055/1) TaxID=556484 RepID=B7GDM4_PHATC|nr:predicted protein [Phaeodactylum tricornutum CCAP 1055/1]EEC43287.1 predicted protein [Phaeodactylum tricornutum CCAP 1055/1]|eukprot:XP_002185155.1 predicted protein [Phaeodactylum tricornutum CCAP 1055/1]